MPTRVDEKNFFKGFYSRDGVMDQIGSPTSIVALKKAFGDSRRLFLRPDALPDVNHFRGSDERTQTSSLIDTIYTNIPGCVMVICQESLKIHISDHYSIFHVHKHSDRITH